jgi:hypothetical protein
VRTAHSPSLTVSRSRKIWAFVLDGDIINLHCDQSLLALHMVAIKLAGEFSIKTSTKETPVVKE